ncbi:MAG: valine--tRNA ligase, partial [Patescibacteria group bacterium]
KTVWFPGTDHAGIATQNIVEKQLKKEGINRWDLGREKFIEKVWEWKNKYGDIIVEQLKKIGASCDWSRFRFTMDEKYAEWVKKAFIHYYEKGLIYRGKRIVSWCVACQTSLSDLEVEYKEEIGKLYFIKYLIVAPTRGGQSDDYIVVATTRPETMLGDAAVAVNPKDERYKKLVGKKILLPIQNREIPIIADDAIDMSFGTGAVKVTPAHDILDAEIGERNKLPQYEIINERGKMTDIAGKDFSGLKVSEAREKVVKELETSGLLEKTEDYKHNIAICYRSGTVLEPLLSDQWFLKMEELAKKTLKTIKSGKTKIIPENFERTATAWLENIRDWCISRQIWWGHQLPVFFCKKIQEEIQNKEFIISIEKPKQCPICKNCEMEQSQDVLDTWFSSALWPFAGLSDEDLKDFYPSNVLITARDIINLWVARMVFSGLEFQKETPFPEVLIHATILTKEGKRMSKSLGTGIDPIGLIEKYGADATRFGIIWQAMGTQDIHWDEAAVQAGKKFANKLWNISRFCQSKIENFKLPISMPTGRQANFKFTNEEDKKILKQFNDLKSEIEKDIEKYELGPALHKLYDFIWHEFADKYIELAKSREDEEVKTALGTLLIGTLKMLHPFMPFITEEIYQRLSLSETQNKGLIISEWE